MRQQLGRKLLVAVTLGLAVAGLIATTGSASGTPTVTIGAHTQFDRFHHWQIDKSVDRTTVTAAPGQQFQLTYTVTLTYLGYADKNYAISDGINVEGGPFTVNSLSDVNVTAFASTGNGSGSATDCSASWDSWLSVVFPFTGSFLGCTYGPIAMGDSLPNGTGTGTVQADVSFAGGGTASGQGTYDFIAGDPRGPTITEQDPCVDVSDTNTTLSPSLICLGDGNGVNKAGDTFVWHYTQTVSFADCGDRTLTNTASFFGHQTGASGESTTHVVVHIPCATGCTLTQGYWKTHSAKGPAPFDDNWNNVPFVYPGAPSGLAEGTPFYFSGQSWYQVFWTPPSGGNAYYILAHQYMAAVLNILNGASSTSAVNSALTAATTYFNKSSSTPTSALSLSKSARNTLLGYATTLGNYNTGLIGPGHCDEDSESSSSP